MNLQKATENEFINNDKMFTFKFILTCSGLSALKYFGFPIF